MRLPIFFSSKKDKMREIEFVIIYNQRSLPLLYLRAVNKLFNRNYGACVFINAKIYSLVLLTKYSRLLIHEIEHIKQMRDDALVPYCVKYLYYSVRYGYDKNPYEVAARVAAESGFRYFQDSQIN